jgi:hypothetical protein
MPHRTTVSTTPADNYVRGLYANVSIVTEMSNYLAAVHGVANPNGHYAKQRRLPIGAGAGVQSMDRRNSR